MTGSQWRIVTDDLIRSGRWLAAFLVIVVASLLAAAVLEERSFALRYVVCAIAGVVIYGFAYSQRALDHPAWPPLAGLQRRQYRETWEALAATVVESDEDRLEQSAAKPLQIIEELVAPGTRDDVLEIGCGMGRIGAALAPRVRSWTGADISPTMLGRAVERMKDFANANFHLLDRPGLDGLSDNSFDVVYCVNVLPHLEEGDRWRYVSEAFRVLRPGGRLLIDGLDLDSDAGWLTFSANAEHFHEHGAPPYTPRFSTAEELATYARRAGFVAIQSHHRSPSVVITATKGSPLTPDT